MFGLLIFSLFSIPKKSTQKEVVNAVKAESVVANVAAVNPSKKTIAGIKPNDFKAISGNKKSVRATSSTIGTEIPFFSAYKYNKAPTLKKNMFMITKIPVKVNMFFLASPILAQLKF